ncbi:acyltransferase [Luteibaculum oceani]|uniref:N-acetyltransferase n=1 Tax=Luteibaculum oceani TaxID=1294296 RepID=A0A5C6VAU8_9FLAO|nr:acyltransferase [Luteibaculum oceani]TXC81691.1 N-acetyltransferase [Luteibaculum oceani]
MSYYAHETAVIDEGCSIGEGVKIWHFTHVMPNSVLGDKCNLGQNVVVSPGVKLGKNVKVQNNVSIYTGVICEDDVFLGPSMVFTNIVNPRSAIVRRDQYVETLVKQGASIGANATVICGNTIGKFALIGAGAVVTKEVPDYALLVGNPAKQIGWVSEFGHRLNFENNLATCPESGQEYRLENNKVIRVK